MSARAAFYWPPVISESAAGLLDGLSVWLGAMAAILFAVWVGAATESSPDLADWLFYGFCAMCSTSLGLREIRWSRRAQEAHCGSMRREKPATWRK
jgi:hypothetical protein